MIKKCMEKEDDIKDNILPFVKPDPLGPKEDNWLLALPLGTVFFCTSKIAPSFIVTEYMRGSSIDEYVLMVENTPIGPAHQYWVDSVKFSKSMKLLIIRECPEPQEQKEE